MMDDFDKYIVNSKLSVIQASDLTFESSSPDESHYIVDEFDAVQEDHACDFRKQEREFALAGMASVYHTNKKAFFLSATYSRFLKKLLVELYDIGQSDVIEMPPQAEISTKKL